MNTQQSSVNPSQPTLCKSCKRFYGCDAFEGHCSTCFKAKSQKYTPLPDPVLQKKQVSAQSSQISEIQLIKVPEKVEKEIKEETPEKKPDGKALQNNRNRCFNCNKKTGLLGIQCKCGYVFCNTHRLPEDHQCTFDHQKAGKQKLQKEVIKVYNGKISQI